MNKERANMFLGDKLTLFKPICHPKTYIRTKKPLKSVALGQPKSTASVGGHLPIATRTQAAISYLRTVGHTRTFKLLYKESATECSEPFFYCLMVVDTTESALSHKEYFCGRESIANKMIKEEVV
jgi:hypothetical protein